MLYFKTEKGKVLNWQYGTDIPGDPTGTKQVFDAWASEQPDRLIIEGGPAEDPRFLKISNGKIVVMSASEKQAVIDAESQAQADAKAIQDSIIDKIAQAAGLTSEEKDTYAKTRKIK